MFSSLLLKKESLQAQNSQESLENYWSFDKHSWANLALKHELPINDSELEKLRGFNENISLKDVQKIYLPVCQLINLHVEERKRLQNIKNQFLGHNNSKSPYIIGISGSVAVGKSTTSRILKLLLARGFKKQKVDLITTDGFLFPNAMLAAKELLNKKGFPESYDLKKMLAMLSALKSGKKSFHVPLYSHKYYDIIPNASQYIGNPDIVIIEGLNILNSVNLSETPTNFVSDFLDFSIYVDGKTEDIKKWYLQRFMAFRKQAANHKELYFHRFAKMSPDEALMYANDIWLNINQANLEKNILPYKYRAQLILKKDSQHNIETIFLRKS